MDENYRPPVNQHFPQHNYQQRHQAHSQHKNLPDFKKPTLDRTDSTESTESSNENYTIDEKLRYAKLCDSLRPSGLSIPTSSTSSMKTFNDLSTNYNQCGNSCLANDKYAPRIEGFPDRRRD
jgi:hypothetical protein